ncbi:histone-lysine N-methyltransferase ATX3-like isoform X2 [Trifolium pratense]|uniref:histone-lysine N-methyltransferase ATX3-like isoform X2 n=1 Tax=Trifolium pratense TaxID=57577 RepID=UPI001E6960BB|nr:histone-lysine N-methyltransferase ATX3-like isoform X2 [Trifolium pratense]
MAETIWNEDTISCYGCGLTLPCKTMKKVKDSSCAPQYYCKSCAKLLKSKQYCGICKKIWHHSDAGDWVCCDGCNVWVHAECDKISSKLLKDLENIDYYCPDCKGKSDCKLSASQTYKSIKYVVIIYCFLFKCLISEKGRLCMWKT